MVKDLTTEGTKKAQSFTEKREKYEYRDKRFNRSFEVLRGK